VVEFKGGEEEKKVQIWELKEGKGIEARGLKNRIGCIRPKKKCRKLTFKQQGNQMGIWNLFALKSRGGVGRHD